MLLTLAIIFLLMAPVEWVLGNAALAPFWMLAALVLGCAQGVIWRVR